MNPFIWYERYGARHGISEDKWKGIVDYIAEKHRMTTAEYINRVNACYSEYLAIRWISDIDHLLESRDEVHMAFIDRALRLGLAIHVVIELFGSLKIKEYFVNNQTIELVAERKGVFAARLRTQ
ncbi:hypothetical protein VE23_07080 [Paenibacillus sp. D9]|nr:hypothetical protein VE23_07080 [Paenibacillus sp. D9]